MKSSVLLLFAAVIIGVGVIACREDVFLPDPPSLVGSYTGTYMYKEGEGVQADSTIQTIKWVFGESNYNMGADAAAEGFDSLACFCKSFGTYSLTDRLRLEPPAQQTTTPDTLCSSCDPERSPQGLFALERQSTGVLKITQIELSTEGTQITKQLLLSPATEP